MKFLLLLVLFVSSGFAQQTSVFEVKGMHCPLCTTAVKKAIKKLDGVEKVSARLNTKKVTVVHDEKVTIDSILKAIKTTSYTGTLLLK
ncbi:heavy-metal-associated domain-containing protein [Arcobacter arenosus]|uniref:Heavy-metal-associated domain-containing protein n=1 Tax=Arcobacter arenosus TaxID=2576037 RepID=A0A5R8XXT3_9BACT|nr:heavy metal-associated domain-containing protein [Arcobacter arenosus]TLP35560.1 heavy-metal-associated domain-containing protein [Arcobacter arenosus]